MIRLRTPFEPYSNPLRTPFEPGVCSNPLIPPGVGTPVGNGVPTGTEGIARTMRAPDWLDYFEERAAIREYEGGFTRAEAERLAWCDTLTAMRARFPCECATGV